MYKAGLYIILLILSLASGTFCSAQQAWKQWFIKTYTATEGLIDTRDGLLKQDPRGFLWIGARGGLSRFNGHTFTTFTTLDGLKENTITDIKSDKAGFMYVATASAIHRYTGGAPAFYRYPMAMATRCRAICPEDSNRIWIARRLTDTLYRWEKQQILAIPVNGPVEWLEQDQDGYVYALTARQQLYVIKDAQVKRRLYMPLLNTTLSRGMYKDNNGWVWCTGYSHVYRLGAGGVTDSLPLPRPERRGQPKGLFYTANDTLLQLQNDRWEILLPLPAVPASVEGIEKDKAGNYWILTAGSLLHLYPKVYNQSAYPALRWYFISPATGGTVLMEDSSVSHHHSDTRFLNRLKPGLTSMYKSRDGTFWYLTRQGLYYRLPGTGELQHYLPPATADSGAIHFTGAAEDKTGGIWFTAATCLYYYQYGRFTRFDLPHKQPEQTVYGNAIDRHQVVYAAAAGKLFAFYKGKFYGISSQSCIEDRIIAGMTTDNAKDLWVWTDSSLLYKIMPDRKGGFEVVDSFEVKVNGKAAIPAALTFDQNGNMWVATRFNMHIFLRLPDRRFSQDHQLVLTGEQRISDLTQGQYRLFQGANNTIYLQNGPSIYAFEARQLIQHYYRAAPDVYLTGLQLYAEKQNWPARGIATDPTGMAVAPHLPGPPHSLDITYTALCPTGAAEIVYRYKLLGFENDWQSVTRSQEAVYTNLPAGNYTFFVQAANASGVWSEPASYAFSIAPAWYATPWARRCWLLLTTAAILLLLYYILQMRSRKKELERVVVEQQLKTLRAQINPHFLQNSFEFLAQSIRFGHLDSSITIIHRIARYFRHILYKSDEIIVTLEDELESAEEYLSLKKMLRYDAFSYSIHIGEEVDTIGVRVPSLLLQPLVENAVKYGVDIPSKTGHISIDVQQNGNYVCIAIADTGSNHNSSRPNKAGYQPKGMELTQKRLTLLYHRHNNKPSVEIIPNPGGGKTVLVKIPLF